MKRRRLCQRVSAKQEINRLTSIKIFAHVCDHQNIWSHWGRGQANKDSERVRDQLSISGVCLHIFQMSIYAWTEFCFHASRVIWSSPTCDPEILTNLSNDIPKNSPEDVSLTPRSRRLLEQLIVGIVLIINVPHSSLFLRERDLMCTTSHGKAWLRTMQKDFFNSCTELESKSKTIPKTKRYHSEPSLFRLRCAQNAL